MDGEEVSMPVRELPEELVERILAMVPFPYIFKARALSKSWLARLSSVSSQDDDEKKHLALSFQKRVREWSFKWKTFCPVFVGREGLVLYDRESHNWRTIPTLSLLAENHLSSERYRKPSILQVEGALLWIRFYVCNGPGSRPEGCLSVANVLTRSWKQLPPQPPTDGLFSIHGELVSHTETYKVIQLYTQENSLRLALIYDSKLGAWSRKRLDLTRELDLLSNSAALNGVLYWLVGQGSEVSGLLALRVEEEIFEVLQMPPTHVHEDYCRVSLVVCNGSLLMVLCEFPHPKASVTVLKIDLESRACFEVTRGPQGLHVYLSCDSLYKRPPSDGECIFFLGEKYEGVKLGITRNVLAYNVRKDEWSSFPLPAIVDQDGCSEYEWYTSSFHPGSSPFVAV